MTDSKMPAVFASRSAKMVLDGATHSQTLHCHRPIELVVALDGPIQLQLEDRRCVSVEGVLVPPMREHALAACEGRLAKLYVDIGYTRLAAWRGRSIRWDLPEVSRLRAELLKFYRSDRRPGEAADLIADWTGAWLPSDDASPGCDPRIMTALAHLDVWDGDIRTDRRAMAELVGLSPTRFAALFAAETGMSLGRYLIWRRVKIALTLVCAGHRVTAAAHAAGFTDAAHLTRSCRATYGCTPSSVGGRTVVLVGDALQPESGRHICLEPPRLPVSDSAPAPPRGHA